MSSPPPGIRRPSYNGAPAISASTAFKTRKPIPRTPTALLPTAGAESRAACPKSSLSKPAPQRARARLARAARRRAPSRKLLRVLRQREDAALLFEVRVLPAAVVLLRVRRVRDLADVDDREQHEDERLHEGHEDAEAHQRHGQQEVRIRCVQVRDLSH